MGPPLAQPIASEGAQDLPWLMTPRESIELIRASRPHVRPSEAITIPPESSTPAPRVRQPAVEPAVSRVSPPARRPINPRSLIAATGIVAVTGLAYTLGQMRAGVDPGVRQVQPVQVAVPAGPSSAASLAPAADSGATRPVVTAVEPVRRPPPAERSPVVRPPAVPPVSRASAGGDAISPATRQSNTERRDAPPPATRESTANPPPVTPPPVTPPPVVASTAAQAAAQEPPPQSVPPGQLTAPAPPVAVAPAAHAPREPDRELGAGGWTVVNLADAGTALGGTIGAIDGLAIESIAQSTAGARVRVRVAQIAESGDRIVLTETRAGASVRSDGPVRVTALRVMPPSEAYPFATGSASLGNVLITAKTTLSADALRQLLDRLAAVQ
jgi:hypothetical protein